METKIDELQKQFPALSRDVCEEMLESGADYHQLKHCNEMEKQKAAEKVKAFIATKYTSDSPYPYPVLNLVLLGKTGVGKSETGNLILGEDVFKASSSTQSCTQNVSVGERMINDVTVRVVDTPGIFDRTEEKTSITNELTKIGFEGTGIHVFVFVRNFGNPRWTADEKEAFKSFKESFPEAALRHCAFLFTRAQDVLYMKDLPERTIEGWVKQNLKGDKVYESVGSRVVGVENIYATPLEKQLQRERLISYFQYMVTSTGGETFARAKPQYEAEAKREMDCLTKKTKKELTPRADREDTSVAEEPGGATWPILDIMRGHKITGKGRFLMSGHYPVWGSD